MIDMITLNSSDLEVRKREKGRIPFFEPYSSIYKLREDLHLFVTDIIS